MPAAEAHIDTDRGSRYLVQLCRHLSHNGRTTTHRPTRRHATDTHTPTGMAAQVTYTDSDATIDFDWGRATLHADDISLTIRATATDPIAVRRIQDLLGDHLERFSRRDPLTVAWQPAPPIGPPPTTEHRIATKRRPGPWAPNWLITETPPRRWMAPLIGHLRRHRARAAGHRRRPGAA